jgi:predicted nucleic acid-binding protein
VARTERAGVYLDASAAVKLIVTEPESEALWRLVEGGTPSSSELLLAEVPRAVRRLAHERPTAAEALLREMAATLRSLSFIAIDREILTLAGRFTEPHLRALDAIHVAAAASVGTLGAFVTYDERQARAALAAGLPLAQPGR